MKRLLFIFGIALAQTFALAQSESGKIENLLLRLNGSGALFELEQSNSTRYDLYAQAWQLMGDEEQALFFAGKNKAKAKSGKDQKRAAALWAVIGGEWEAAKNEYESLREKTVLDFYHYLTAINQGGGAPESRLSTIEQLLERQKPGEYPAIQLCLVDALANARQFERAGELLNPLQNSLFPYIKNTAYEKLARLHLLKRELEQAFDRAEQALGKNREIHHENGMVYCYYLMGVAKARQGAFEEAKKWSRQGAALARKIGNRQLEYHLNNTLSWAYFSNQESFDHILEHETRQFHLVNEMGDEMKKAGVYNNLAYDHTVAGRIPLDSAISLQKYANDVYARQEGNNGRWYTLMNLVWQHRLKGEYEQSAAYAKMSVDQALAIEDRHAVIEAAFQYGETLLAQGKIDEAGQYYDLGLQWRTEEEDRDAYVFDVYYANYLWATGEEKQAIERLEDAVQFLTTSEVFYEMHGRALLAKYYLEWGRLEKAREQLGMIESPRSDYIAFESRWIAAQVRAALLEKEGNTEAAEALRRNYGVWVRKLGYGNLR